MKSKRFKCFLQIFSIFLMMFCSSQGAFADSFDKGLEYFQDNKPEKAIPLLKDACNEGNHPEAFNYLAIAYLQTGDFQKGVDICSLGMNSPGTDKKLLSFNAGNLCFKMENYSEAVRWYSKSMVADPDYHMPMLNRANSKLNMGNYQEARQDYITYLEMEPEDPQRPQIEEIIRLLEEKIEAQKKAEEQKLAEQQRIKEQEERLLAEQQRLAEEQARQAREAEERRQAEEARRLAEEQAQKAEQERLAKEAEAARLAKEAEQARLAKEAAERAAKEAEERQRKLQEELEQSLKNANTTNLSAGAEGTVDYGYESELE